MEENIITWPAAITAIVALYGAFLSSINFIKERRQNSRRVKISLAFGFTDYQRGTICKDIYLTVTIFNPGLKTVTLNRPKFKINDGNMMFYTDDAKLMGVEFPFALEEGKNTLIHLDLRKLKDAFMKKGYIDKIKIKGVVSNQTGQTFFSNKWMKIELN